MGAIDLAATMDAIAARLTAELPPGTTAYPYPADNVAVPAAVVAYPEDPIDYDETFREGTDHLVIPVYVLVGRPNERAARDLISSYVSGAGARSVKVALDGDLGGAVGSSAVVSCQITTFAVAAIDYLAARFDLDIYT